MSDFDREAERERLREKYEQDREKRASTQRMSELLLRGATMTDSHCEACGDPIFRYEGQEFCATCRAEGDTAGEGEAADADAADAGERAPRDDDPAAREETPARGPAADDSRPDAAPPPVGNGVADAAPAPERDDRPAESGRDDRPAASGRDDVTAARASLERTLARFARRAEESDSPREAADHLAAAREAAEALAALRR
jgi:uncharacterized Zn finger protein (UPF0148 family)